MDWFQSQNTESMTSSAGRLFTYWSLLGLQPGSDANQLKQAFKREAMRWHPDLNKNDKNAEERFKWINEAYKVLSDPKSRFEWETAGRPAIEIFDSYDCKHLDPVDNEVQSISKGKNKGFSSLEKFVVLLISIFCLLVLNAF